MKKHWYILFLVLAPNAHAFQLNADNQTTTPALFLESAYFSLGTPTGKNLLFEAEPTVHFFLLNPFGDLKWQGGDGFRVTFPLSFLPTVRMFREFSEPVRTPSYHIRLMGQAYKMQRTGRCYSMYGFYGQVAHYSNGQSGCTFQGQSKIQDGQKNQCIVDDPVVYAKRLANSYDGDFSTSYFGGGMNWAIGFLQAEGDLIHTSYAVTVDYQYHPIGGMVGATNAEQAKVFGNQELRFKFEAAKSVGADVIHGLTIEPKTRFGQGINPMLALKVEYHVGKPTRLPASFFVRGHVGYDYYNIHFQDDRPFLALGMRFEPDRLLFLQD